MFGQANVGFLGFDFLLLGGSGRLFELRHMRQLDNRLARLPSGGLGLLGRALLAGTRLIDLQNFDLADMPWSDMQAAANYLGSYELQMTAAKQKKHQGFQRGKTRSFVRTRYHDF